MTTENKTEKKPKENKLDFDVKEMADNGLHLGHQTSKLHPKMSKYIVGIRNTIHIIDLEKTAEKLKEALIFISETYADGEKMLFVGTKPPIREEVKKAATECGSPYVNERWLGGIFTNFDVISKRIGEYKKLLEEKEKGNFDKMTKKEKAKAEKKFEKMKAKFDGIKEMAKIPSAVFVVGADREKTCIKEAKLRGVKVIAVADTNINPEEIDFPIPANDDSIASVRYILEKVVQAAKKGIKNEKREMAKKEKVESGNDDKK